MEDSPRESSSVSTVVLAIAELREAILIALGNNAHITQLVGSNSQSSDDPVVELFPLQRISRAFATTIRTSPELRNLMCLNAAAAAAAMDKKDPLRWLLRKLNRRLTDQYVYSNAELRDFALEQQHHESGNRRNWMVSESWARSDASWRSMRARRRRSVDCCDQDDIADDNNNNKILQLHFRIHPDFEGGGVSMLEIDDNALPTLGKIYDSINRTVMDFEDQIAAKEVRRVAETGDSFRHVLGSSILRKIDFRSSLDWDRPLEWVPPQNHHDD